MIFPTHVMAPEQTPLFTRLLTETDFDMPCVVCQYQNFDIGSVVSEDIQADGLTDTTSILCVDCMNFVQRMHGNSQWVMYRVS
jgi:hypothetical protein